MIFDIFATLADPLTEITKAVLNYLKEKQVSIGKDQSIIVDSKGDSKNKYLVARNPDGTTQVIDLRNFTSRIWELLRLYKKGGLTLEEFRKFKEIVFEDVCSSSTKRNSLQIINSVQDHTLQNDEVQKNTLTNVILRDPTKIDTKTPKNPMSSPIMPFTTSPTMSKTCQETTCIQCGNCGIFIPRHHQYCDQCGFVQEKTSESINNRIEQLEKRLELFHKRKSAFPDNLKKENELKSARNKKEGKISNTKHQNTGKNVRKSKKTSSRKHTIKPRKSQHNTITKIKPKPRMKASTINKARIKSAVSKNTKTVKKKTTTRTTRSRANPKRYTTTLKRN